MGCAAPNPLHWQDLCNRPPEDILAMEGVVGAADGRSFEMRFLDTRFLVDPVAERIAQLSPDPSAIPSQSLMILLIRYLTTPQPGGLVGTTITEKELPGGPTFFRGPHALPVHAVVERFGRDPNGFSSRGLSLGAEPVDLGDRALRFWPFANVPLTYVLWLADDEFEARVSVLLDRSIGRWFQLDTIFLLVQQVSQRIAGG